MPVTNPPRIEILDEGISKGRVTRQDFVGAGVTAAVVGELATITIPGGGGSAFDPVTDPFILAIRG